MKRYKYNGSFRVSYLTTIYGEKGSPDYSKQTNFQFLWNHSQDSKANPNMTLSASVNFTTSGYSRNDLGSYYSSSFTENTKGPRDIRIHTDGVVPQPHRHHVADLPLQAQTRCGKRTLV